MSYDIGYAARQDGFASDAALDLRLGFIRRVYAHVLGATLLFVAASTLFVKQPALISPIIGLVRAGQWWLLLVSFMVVGWVAQAMARNRSNIALQYVGLGAYSLVEAVIFSPMLWWISTQRADGPELLMQSGTITLIIFGGLTTIVMVTKADFSFLRNILCLAAITAVGIALVSAFAGFSLGLLFVSAMILLFSGWILYDTSNILHHYPTDMHVAAALELFASLATLFWYVLRLMSILNRR